MTGADLIIRWITVGVIGVAVVASYERACALRTGAPGILSARVGRRTPEQAKLRADDSVRPGLSLCFRSPCQRGVGGCHGVT